MDAEQKVGCLVCRYTGTELGYYEFKDLTGQLYHAYFCHPCFATFQRELNSATPVQQVQYHVNLAKLITGK